MLIQKLALIENDIVTNLIGAIRKGVENGSELGAFDGMPVKVLFAPEQDFPASLHYMFFPAGGFQRFHHHPDGRHLVLLGDTPLRIRHSLAPPDEEPFASVVTTEIPAGQLTIVRSKPLAWHEFSAPKREVGTGIIAFSFHDKDSNTNHILNMLMRDTVFFDELRNEVPGAGQ